MCVCVCARARALETSRRVGARYSCDSISCCRRGRPSPAVCVRAIKHVVLPPRPSLSRCVFVCARTLRYRRLQPRPPIAQSNIK